jgi:hypothetical protein
MSHVTRRGALEAAFAGGIAAIAPAAVADDKKPEDFWRAWAVTEGDKTQLVVEGVYHEGGPGLIVLLKDAVPQGINPKILILDLKTATLPGVWPAVLHPVPARDLRAPYKKGQYDSVTIRYPKGQLVTVKIVDAGAGPK